MNDLLSPTGSPNAATADNVTPLRRQNVIAVASGKGGVGKTFFSVTLAHALARTGKRTLLFDGDLGLANVDIQLGLMPKRDLGQVIDGMVTLQGAAQRFPEGGFDIIAGRSGTGTLANLPPARLTQLRTELSDVARNYDWVVIDLGAGVDRMVRTFSGPAGTTLVVTTDEPTSITDAYAFLKLSYQANPMADLRVVINMADSKALGEKTYEKLLTVCQRYLKMSPKLGGIVRRDAKVREAIRNQSPLFVRFPTSDAAHDIENVANRLNLGG